MITEVYVRTTALPVGSVLDPDSIGSADPNPDEFGSASRLVKLAPKTSLNVLCRGLRRHTVHDVFLSEKVSNYKFFS